MNKRSLRVCSICAKLQISIKSNCIIGNILEYLKLEMAVFAGTLLLTEFSSNYNDFIKAPRFQQKRDNTRDNSVGILSNDFT